MAGAPLAHTPIMRAFDWCAFIQVATPARRAPSPTGTRIASNGCGQRSISSPIVPAPSLMGGEHLIRMRVLSADNSYDQSGSIRGSFAPGGEKVLTAQFNKNNRGMRLSLQ
jgi:hypothetical protein